MQNSKCLKTTHTKKKSINQENEGNFFHSEKIQKPSKMEISENSTKQNGEKFWILIENVKKKSDNLESAKILNFFSELTQNMKRKQKLATQFKMHVKGGKFNTVKKNYDWLKSV